MRLLDGVVTVWDGASWRNLADVLLMPRGYIGTVVGSTDVTGITTVETDVVTGPINLVIGRRYELTVSVPFDQSVGTDVFILRGYIAGTLKLFAYAPSNVSNFIWYATSDSYVAAATGASNVKVTVQRNSGTGTGESRAAAIWNSKLTIKDIGI